MNKDLFDKGLKTRREVLGADRQLSRRQGGIQGNGNLMSSNEP